jgi:cobalt/nickel transport system ATP-binding protein
VEIDSLCFRYPDETLALDGVSLRIAEGERVALLGANGAGKSTLMLHLNGLLRGEGRITIRGREVSERNLRQIRQEVGLVFQSPDDQLFMPTVFDEVAFAAINAGYEQDEVRERVAAALSTVGMSGYEQKHPINLSVGQKKRVAIASVLVTDNHLLVLDEPTAGLDPAGQRALLALLQGLASTMVVATHDLALAEALCERAVVMQAGRIVREGKTPEVLSDQAFLRSSGL